MFYHADGCDRRGAKQVNNKQNDSRLDYEGGLKEGGGSVITPVTRLLDLNSICNQKTL